MGAAARGHAEPPVPIGGVWAPSEAELEADVPDLAIGVQNEGAIAQARARYVAQVALVLWQHGVRGLPQLAAGRTSASARRAAAAARWPSTEAEQGAQYGVAATSSSAMRS